MPETIRIALKTELLQHLEILDLQARLFPSSQERINELVVHLESLNPIPHPLQPQYLSSLLGYWQLIYASQGTAVTRQLASIPNPGGIKIKRVWQRLLPGNPGEISASNGAEIELTVFGEWQLCANGIWKWMSNEQTAKVFFDSFSIQAIKPFGFSNCSFPKFTIPVIEFFQKEALWITSYLDQELRIGRGVTGNLFVFRRD